MNNEPKSIRIGVACVDSLGAPSLLLVRVECTEQQVNNGEHYDASRRWVEKLGYEYRLAFDEADPAGLALNTASHLWQDAKTIGLPQVHWSYGNPAVCLYHGVAKTEDEAREAFERIVPPDVKADDSYSLHISTSSTCAC